MKSLSSFLLLFSFMLTGTSPATAQPLIPATLYKIDGNVIKTKVRKITTTQVYYTDSATPNAPRGIPKAEVWKLVYADGHSTVFNAPKGEVRSSSPPPMSMSQPLMALMEPVATSSEPTQVNLTRQETSSTLVRPAVEGTGARSIIKYAPLSSFGFERVLTNNHSLYAGISLYSLGFGASAIGLKAEYRFYGLIKSSARQAPEGFWVAPTVLVWRVSVIDFYKTQSAFVTQVGGIAGYQWIFNKKISLEPALGISLTAVGSGSDTSLGAGVVPLFAVRVGYILK